MLRNSLIAGLLVAASTPALAAVPETTPASVTAPVAAPAAAEPAATAAPDTSTAPSATTASATAYTTTETKLGALLDDPAAKAIVDKYIPGLSASPQIDMARKMTLKEVQALAPAAVKDEQLAQVDAELAKLTAHG